MRPFEQSADQRRCRKACVLLRQMAAVDARFQRASISPASALR